MTEIEELIEQATAVLKKWRLPRKPEVHRPSYRSWQDLLDNRGYNAKTMMHLASRPRGL